MNSVSPLLLHDLILAALRSPACALLSPFAWHLRLRVSDQALRLLSTPSDPAKKGPERARRFNACR
jgi:hypothetical protein